MPDDEQQPLASVFGKLLDGYMHALSRSRPSPRTREALFSGLLAGFLVEYERASKAEADEARRELSAFGLLLGGYAEAVEAWRKAQEGTADDFNLLSVMKVSGDELRHSMVLAWLLDHDLMRLGTHAQGRLGFRLFLHELGLPSNYADEPYTYWVRREAAGDESRVDIEVAARGRFLIGIENKIWSTEGPDQTDREWGDLLRRAKQLGVRSDPDSGRVHALFLTLEGAEPSNPHFQAVSWRKIARVFERFAAEAKPPEVRLFSSHYARALRELSRAPSTQEETDNGQGVVQRGRALPDPELAVGAPYGTGNGERTKELRRPLRKSP